MILKCLAMIIWVTCDRFSIPVNKQIHVENNTWTRVNMEFLFECSTQYLASERRERVKYRVELEKRNSMSKSNHVLFYLLYKHRFSLRQASVYNLQVFCFHSPQPEMPSPTLRRCGCLSFFPCFFSTSRSF